MEAACWAPGYFKKVEAMVPFFFITCSEFTRESTKKKQQSAHRRPCGSADRKKVFKVNILSTFGLYSEQPDWGEIAVSQSNGGDGKKD